MIMPMETGSDCLCPQCLPEKINLKIEEFISTHSVQDAVATAQKYKTPELLENIDYVIEEGKWIFSKWYHLKRGTCCESGCIHCPYDED